MAISTLNEDELKADPKAYTKWRSKRIGSSDIPVILGESPFKTPYQLWKEKTGRVDSSFYTNHAIELGKQFEDAVRVGLELSLDIEFPPTIMQDDTYTFMTSSLDGYNKDNEIVLEIKCVKGGPTWEKACEDICSDSYISQVQHQLYVSKAKKAFFYVAKLEADAFNVYRIADTRLVEVYPDKEKQEVIVKAALEFYKLMTSDMPPAMTSKDKLVVADSELADFFKEQKLQLAKYLNEKFNHVNFEFMGHRLLRDANGVWRLTLTKC